jgi:hypothetical protein
VAEAAAANVYQALADAVVAADATCLASGTDADVPALEWIDLADGLPAFDVYPFYAESGVWDIPALLDLKTCGIRSLAFEPPRICIELGETRPMRIVGRDAGGKPLELGDPPRPFRQVHRVEASGATVERTANDRVTLTPSRSGAGSVQAAIFLSGGTLAYEGAATIEVPETASCGIAGTWLLTPVSQQERCRYTGHAWWTEDPFPPFEVAVTQPDGSDDPYIRATYVPDVGLGLAGIWDAGTGVFLLSVATGSPAECGYLFEESDICGDAVDCRMESCRCETEISGTTSSPDVDTLDAASTWYYRVTFSFEVGGTSRGQTTWECEGSAAYDGVRR